MYNLVELFSGIGSQAKALSNMKIKYRTVATCEWDIHAFVAYDAIHQKNSIPEEYLLYSKEELLSKLGNYTFSGDGKTAISNAAIKGFSVGMLRRLYAAIERNNNYIDINGLIGNELPQDIDIMTYSFPCQDLSNVGAFHGYNKGIDPDSGSRSSLLWQVGRILNEIQQAKKPMPRYLVMENVPSLLSERHFGHFKKWIALLEDIGYCSYYFPLNASSFGIPQNRPRLLMLSVYVGEDREKKELVKSYLGTKLPVDIVNDYRNSPYYREIPMKELLRTDYSNAKLFAEAKECTPNDTVSRQQIWDENPQLVLRDGSVNEQYRVIRTVTTKQDRNPNSGNLYFESGIEGKSKFRYLTPRECFLFMGFTDEDYDKVISNNPTVKNSDVLFTRDKLIRMAGNSIPVKLVEGIFYQILKIDELLNVRIDRHSRETRSYNMSQIKATDTKPEEIVRKYLTSKGIKYRKNDERYAGSPDVVVPSAKTAIFVNGCFWHKHEECGNFVWPKTNVSFWKQKIETNVNRDKRNIDILESQGWNVITIWECQLKTINRESTLEGLYQELIKKRNCTI